MRCKIERFYNIELLSVTINNNYVNELQSLIFCDNENEMI